MALEALVFLIALAVSCEALFNITGSDSTRYLYDSAGRVRLFQGTSIVMKGPPWYDANLLNDSYVADLAASGFNVVRLGFMWTGAEPQEGKFNATYYAIMRTIVLKLASHNIYTLLDVHQDCLSTKFCLYDGVPLWVIDRSVAREPFPFPLKGSCSRPWALNELTEAAGQVRRCP